MKYIYKYPLEIMGEQEIEMPDNARILSLQCQEDIPTIWALVDTSEPVVKRTFLLVGTGQPLNDLPLGRRIS